MKWSVICGATSKADATRIVAAVLSKATGETGSLTHNLPRQGKNPACTQNGLAIRHADPLREYQRARAAQQHGFALQPGAKQRRRQVIRIQADGGEEPCHPGQIEATNPERQVRKSRQHAAMGHVLAIAVALFNAKPEGKRPVIAPDHDGADGFQKRPSGGARHEAFRNGGCNKIIQGRATFGLNGAGSSIPEARPGKRQPAFALAFPQYALKSRPMRSDDSP